MAENIKELIEKIQQEGVNVAEEKAKKIEEEAKAKAEKILQQAQEKAQNILNAAKAEISKTEAASLLSLKQASRDLFLSLKKEINSMLLRIISTQIQKALGPEELGRIIRSLIEECVAKNCTGVTISMKNEDLDKLRDSILKGLKEEVAKGIKLKSAEDISGGFVISYDANKSHFDFTDKALAEFLGLSLKPRLSEILKETTD